MEQSIYKSDLQSFNKGFLFMLLGGVIVGVVPVMAKMISAPAAVIVFYRMILPIPILLLLKNFSLSEQGTRIYPKKDLILMLLIGFFFSLDVTTFYISLHYTSVAIATLLSNFSPLFLLTYRIIKTRKLGGEVFWFALALGGLWLLCNLDNGFSVHELYGDAIALISAAFFTLYILSINRLGSQYSSIDIMLWSSSGGAILLIILCLVTQTNISIGSYHSLLLLILMAWGNQLIGQTLLTSAISRLPPSFTSLSILIDPIVATICAWIVLKESLGLSEVLGVILILISILGSHRLNMKKFHVSKESVNE